MSRALLLSILIFASALPGVAKACSCAPRNTLGDHLDRAVHVFRARVTRVQLTLPPADLRDDEWLDPTGSPPSPVASASFRLIQSFKGDGSSLDAVYTHQDSATCGLPMDAGQEYLFFADGKGVVGLCGGNISSDSPRWGDVLRQLIRGISTGSEIPPPVEIELP
jgi:hypothetical protein